MRSLSLSGVLLVATLAVAPVASAADVPPDRVVATAWFEALLRGDLEAVYPLVAAPFWFDGKEAVPTKEGVDEKMRAVVREKGPRKVPEYRTETPEDAAPLDPKVFPAYTVVRFRIGDERVDVYVSAGGGGAAPKVIGFLD